MQADLVWSSEKNKKLRERIAKMPAVFSLLEEPLLASLVCCRGIQFELNTPLNRLSDFLGVPPNSQWNSKIRKNPLGYQLEISLQDGSELFLQHEKLVDVISPHSLDSQGRLYKLVIDPVTLAQIFKTRGIDLVIVRDWILASGLAKEPDHAVNYFKANPWELKNNVGYQQCELLVNYQLPFFGTHDMVDHVAGSHSSGLLKSSHAILQVYQKMQSVFNSQSVTIIDLTYSYLLSLLLDDLGQPFWHGSQIHEKTMLKILEEWEAIRRLNLNPRPTFEVPEQFSTIMETLRISKMDGWQEVELQIDALKNIWQPALAVS